MTEAATLEALHGVQHATFWMQFVICCVVLVNMCLIILVIRKLTRELKGLITFLTAHATNEETVMRQTQAQLEDHVYRDRLLLERIVVLIEEKNAAKHNGGD